MPRNSREDSLEERFLRAIAVSRNGCWIWTGEVMPEGYGRLRRRTNGSLHRVYAHRFSYELKHGPIPADLVIDHLCRVRHCVNPRHLRVVTNRENIMAGEGVGAVNARKTECKHGHPFDESNTYVQPSRGTRQCRQCQRDRYRQKGDS